MSDTGVDSSEEAGPAGRARMAAVTLAENAGQTERDCRPTANSLASVRAAGLFGLAVPVRDGGLGADLRTSLEVAVELGRGCPSTAWVTALTAGAKLMLARLVTEEARVDLFADPAAIVSSSAVPGGELTSERVPGGVRFSGRWKTASGCEDASWTTVAVPIRDGEQVTRMAALIPAGSLTVDRTWDVAGMSGTGSHTLVADRVFVAETHLLPMALADGRSRIPVLVTLGSMFIALGALLGAALAARDLVQRVLAEGRAASGTSYQSSVDSPLARYWFSEASHLMDTAVQRCRLATEVLDTAGLDGSLPVQERSRLRMELVTAAQECRQGMEKLLDLHGASGFVRSNPLQRLWRDVAVGTRHPQFSPWITAEDYGRVLFGVDTPAMRGL